MKKLEEQRKSMKTARENQRILLERRKLLLESKKDEDKKEALKITHEIARLEDFIKKTENRLKLTE